MIRGCCKMHTANMLGLTPQFVHSVHSYFKRTYKNQRSAHHTEHLWFLRSSKYGIILIRLSRVPVATPRKASSHAELWFNRWNTSTPQSNSSSYRFWIGCATPRVSGSLCTNILNQLNPWSVLRQAIRSKSLVGRTSWEAALLYQRWVLSTGEQPFMPCCLNNIKQVFKAADMSSSGI